MVLTALAVFVSIPAVVLAGHNQFTDVPDGHTHHTAIGWMLDSGITEGCNPPTNDNYCPSDNVTRAQMATFMKRLAENQVVDAATAVTAGTAYEAINDSGVSVTGTNSATADSIATLSDLPAGSYVVTATWIATMGGTDTGARVVCTLSAGSSEAGANALIANSDHPGGQESMAAVTTGTLSSGDEVNLSCHRESATGTTSIGKVRVVAYTVSDIVSETVTS